MRTGRILNVSCVPSDPHSPTILCNYLTSPDCVIWSAVLASAAVPGILNPVVLMMKNPDGSLSPYSFGHKVRSSGLLSSLIIFVCSHNVTHILMPAPVERRKFADRYTYQGSQPPLQCQFYYCKPGKSAHLIILFLLEGYGRLPRHT